MRTSSEKYHHEIQITHLICYSTDNTIKNVLENVAFAFAYELLVLPLCRWVQTSLLYDETLVCHGYKM